jgi:cardiolipin synthase
MNIPNFLTILRILSIPLFIILLSYGFYSLALLLFFCAGVTDALDGFLARTFKQKTTLGAYLDPIADKLLLSSSFVDAGVAVDTGHQQRCYYPGRNSGAPG